MQGKSVGIRFLATLIDVIILWIAVAIVQGIFGGGSSASIIGMFLIATAYYIVMEGLFGATVGKFVVGIRVKMLDGKPCTWKAAVIRTVLRVVDGFLVYLVAAIVVWASKKNQRLGDMAAKTLVVAK